MGTKWYLACAFGVFAALFWAAIPLGAQERDERVGEEELGGWDEDEGAEHPERPHRGEGREGEQRRDRGEQRRDRIGHPERPGAPADEEGAEKGERFWIQKALQHLKRRNPEQFYRLQELRQTNPDQVREHLRGMVDQVKHLWEMKKRNPERFKQIERMEELEAESNGLARAVREAKGEEKAAARDNLREHISKLFDEREKGREQEIQELEKRLQELRALSEKRRAAKDEIIKRRIAEMSGEGDDMRW